MKSIALGTRIGIGFAVIIAIAIVLGVAGYYGAVKIDRSSYRISAVDLPAVIALKTLQEDAQRLKVIQRNQLNPGMDAETRARQYTNLEKVKQAYQVAFEAYKALPKTQEETAQFAEIEAAWTKWSNDNNDFMQLARAQDDMHLGDPNLLRQSLEIFRGDHYKLKMNVLNMIVTGKTFAGGEDDTQCNYGKWKANLKLENPELREMIQQCEATHHQFHQSIKAVKEFVVAKDLKAASAHFESEISPAADATLKQLETMALLAAKAQSYLELMEKQAIDVCRKSELKANELLTNAVETMASEARADTKNTDRIVAFTKMLAVCMTVSSGLVGAALAFFITRSIANPIKTVSETLMAGAEQTTSAAGQVSTSSQSLADGASEQAASLEETSSSLEEMSSMTKRNAENAHKANELARQARSAADKGVESMRAMTQAVEAIKHTSDDTAKIIKTIDEIAFQTNILALNAAVEAARAGDAGMGFAVVADEVRNLAQRSAQAARETSGQIEGAIAKTTQGVQISEQVAKQLQEIVACVRQVDDLIAEVALASKEQDQGLEQITTAVTQMDRILQSNAASAEESASAAEELRAQALSMHEAVAKLRQLVNGAAGTENPNAPEKHLTHFDTPAEPTAESRPRPHALSRRSKDDRS